MVPQNKLNSNVYLSWSDIENLVQNAIEKIKIDGKKYDAIIGITNGGIVPARLIAREANINNINFVYMLDKKVQNNILPVFNKEKKYLIVDDIYDTGYTHTVISKLMENIKIDHDFIYLLGKHNITINRSKKSNTYIGTILNHDRWIVFPWEKN